MNAPYFKDSDEFIIVNKDITILKRSESPNDNSVISIHVIRDGKIKLIGILFGIGDKLYKDEYFVYNENYMLLSSVMNIKDYSKGYPDVKADIKLTMYDIENDMFIHSYSEEDNRLIRDIFDGNCEKEELKRIRRRNHPFW